MDRETQTSFIPKAALTRSSETITHTVGLGMVIGVLVLVLSLALWGGTYAYGQILTKNTTSLQASLEKARQDLDQATTLFLRRLSDKLLIGDQLVAGHQTLVPVFKMLEELTLPSVYYSKFNYANGAMTIEGRASSYEDIAVQTQVFGRDTGRIKSFIFSDLDLDGFGNVIFKLVINLEPEVTAYNP